MQIFEKEILFKDKNLKYYYLDILEWLQKNSRHIEIQEYTYYQNISFMYFFHNRTGEYGGYDAFNLDRPLFNLIFSKEENNTLIKIIINNKTHSEKNKIDKYLGIIGLFLEHYNIPLSQDEKKLFFNKDWKFHEILGIIVP